MIWVIGGTKDSRDFLEKIIKFRTDIIVTTATEYGGKLLENLPIKVVCQKLPLESMKEFVGENKISWIVDLSHPYAVEVSKNALQVSKEKNIPYYRFEREEIPFRPNKYSSFDSIEDLVRYIEKCEGNILVTLGSNNIGYFSQINNLKNCYFRILPKWDMVKKCEDIGILPKNIIAMQGPFSKELNIALIKEYNIKFLVTKEAGATGGEKEKVDSADECDIEIVFLSRPKVIYPNVFSDIDSLVKCIACKVK